MYIKVSSIFKLTKKFSEHFFELRKMNKYKRFICTPEKNIKCKETHTIHTKIFEMLRVTQDK